MDAFHPAEAIRLKAMLAMCRLVRTIRTAMKSISLLLLTLHAAAADWHPVPDKMLTRWGKNLTPVKVWTEHPRPQLVRESWKSLNGLWNHAIRPKDSAQPDTWDGKILVPFAPEAALSGVGRLLEPDQSLWYQRELRIKPIPGERTLLHFEAVDYQTTVWVNGTEIGHHTGGHTPFSFDITDALKPDGNQLVVRVFDATEGFQLHGKQKLKPGGIWYTRVSGIWQTVWLEQVPARHVSDLDFSCDIRSGTLRVRAKLAGVASDGERLRVTASIDGRQVAEATGAANTAELKIPEPKLWSPDAPNLYDLDVKLIDAAGTTIDSVKSYAALREFGKARDAGGHLRFTLNGKPIFHWGPLDQGWWPDGLLTPPSDEAMISDIRFLKDAGFNMIRKHIKVEPRRYYHHCDRLGMLMWQDQVSTGYGHKHGTTPTCPPWTRMAPDPKDADWPDDAHRQWLLEYQRMVDHLRDSACIAAWIPFNEAWGQHRSMEIGELAARLDPTRHVNLASGGNFWPVGDIADHHNYPNPEFPLDDPRFNDFIKVVGEFGGHGWPVEGHLWNKSAKNWGYGGLPQSLDEWQQRYARSIDILCDLRGRGIAGGVYTQTSDVENEINGLLTYDRIPKIDAAWLKKQSDRLLHN
jgi:beta-galactosidase